VRISDEAVAEIASLAALKVEGVAGMSSGSRMDALAEAWGRTMYGGIAQWCRQHGVQSTGHFMEHGNLYQHREFCAGDMMRLQGHGHMGGIAPSSISSSWASG
jgi:hypothetical protein